MTETVAREAQDRAQKVRVNANFSRDAYEILADIAEKRGKSISDVLRDAIAFEKWYQDTIDDGGHVLVERDGGRVLELVRP